MLNLASLNQRVNYLTGKINQIPIPPIPPVADTLSAVLVAGNSAGSSAINMNTNAISNITTATAKTSLVVNDAIVGQNATLTTQNLTINNAGLTPALTLNQSGVGSGILYEEMYNQRTAITGEFNRMGFYSKSSTGAKIEYARIKADAPVITSGSSRGRMDLGVQQGSGIVNYLTLNGQVGSVGLGASLDCNSNDITECNSITTPLSNTYSKEQVVYLNANTTAPNSGFTLESNLRYTAFNLGKVPEWIQAPAVTPNGFVAGVENITASYDTWDGKFWVGTDVGNVYYSSDGGVNWTIQGSYGGRIRVFCPYNSASVMAVGGDFSSVSYNYLVGINNSGGGYSSFDITAGLTGMNAPVYALYDNSINVSLYIGGAFDDFFGILGSLNPKWVTLDYNTSIFYPFSNNAGNGFFGGDVLSISQDTLNSGHVLVGGSFTSLTANGNTYSVPHLITYSTGTGYDLTGIFFIPTTLNGVVNDVLPYSGGIMIFGGAFTNPLVSPTWTENYGMAIYWNGTNWEESNYPFINPLAPISWITHFPNIGVFYTNVGGNTIWANGVEYVPNIPTGSAWECVAYNGSISLFATNNQSGVGFLFYYYDQAVGLTITGGGNTFNSINGSNFTNCFLTGLNSAVEMLWNSTLSKWFVISQQGCSFS